MVAQMSTWGPSVLQLEVEKLAAMAEAAINDLGTPLLLPTLALARQVFSCSSLRGGCD